MRPHVSDEQAHRQEPPSLEGTSTPLPVIRRRPWMSSEMLGIILPLTGGFLTWLGEGWGFLTACLLVALAAYWLRSWWALLIGPALYACGLVIGAVALPLLQGGWPILQARIAEHFEPLDIIVSLGSWLIILSAGLGVLVSRKGHKTP